MINKRFNNQIAMRIDVDYPHLVPDAVDFMLDALGRHGLKATFFLALGGSSCDVSFGRLFSPTYLQRLYKLRAWRLACRMFGQARRHEEIIERIIGRINEEGHELAVHGLRHSWWIDNVWMANVQELQNEISNAYDYIKRKCGRDDMAWGSPGWKTTDDVVGMLEKRNVPYLAECWGYEPFRPICNGKEMDIIHLPITLPSFESRAMTGDWPADTLVSGILDERPSDRCDMVVCHDYYEGFLRRDIFQSFVCRCSELGLQTISLAAMAGMIKKSGCILPACAIAKGKVPGFWGEVSWQEKR